MRQRLAEPGRVLAPFPFEPQIIDVGPDRQLGPQFSGCLPGLMRRRLMLAADAATAAIWEWGCIGALGSEQIIFNRNRLIVIAGKGSPGKLDDFVHGGQFAAKGGHSSTAIAIVATYRPDENNDGLVATLRFTGEDGDRKLILIEQFSRRIGHSARLIAHCRDETVDRFRKNYRVERDQEPPRIVTLVCMEYQLSAKGGRTCR